MDIGEYHLSNSLDNLISNYTITNGLVLKRAIFMYITICKISNLKLGLAYSYMTKSCPDGQNLPGFKI